MAESDQLRALGCTAEFANTVDALTDGNVLSRITALENAPSGGGLTLVVISAPGVTTMLPNRRYLVTVAGAALRLPFAPVPSVNDEIEIIGLRLNVSNGGGGDSKLWIGALFSNVDALYGPADTTICAMKLVAFRLNNIDGIDWAVVAHEGDITDTPPA